MAHISQTFLTGNRSGHWQDPGEEQGNLPRKPRSGKGHECSLQSVAHALGPADKRTHAGSDSRHIIQRERQTVKSAANKEIQNQPETLTHHDLEILRSEFARENLSV